LNNARVATKDPGRIVECSARLKVSGAKRVHARYAGRTDRRHVIGRTGNVLGMIKRIEQVGAQLNFSHFSKPEVLEH
jgi:hypothetical protein